MENLVPESLLLRSKNPRIVTIFWQLYHMYGISQWPKTIQILFQIETPVSYKGGSRIERLEICY
jgi:hypothetical protein